MPQVEVPLRDLSCFDHLLDGPASRDGSSTERFTIATAQPACETQVSVLLA